MKTNSKLAALKGQISRAEMKEVVAGGNTPAPDCRTGSCSVYNRYDGVTYHGQCGTVVVTGKPARCLCFTTLGDYNPEGSSVCAST